jgi:hypothetical protein
LRRRNATKPIEGGGFGRIVGGENGRIGEENATI